MFNLSDDTPLPPEARGGVWLIGNFDGVHKGHQAMIAALKAKYPRVNVLTFSPHPRAFFKPDQAPYLLTTLAEKQALLEALGVDVLVVRAFNSDFAAHTAQAFIENILIGQLGAQRIAVGQDFRFGHQRSGDTALLQQHLPVDVFAPFCDESGLPYSSSRIRQALADGNAALAEKLLGNKAKRSI